jgi:hypothetical protein
MTMRTVIKFKVWGVMLAVAMAWLFGTLVPLASDIVQRFTDVLGQTLRVLLPGIASAEYSVAATFLGPLAPVPGSSGEMLLRMSLIFAPLAGAVLLVRMLAFPSGHRDPEQPQLWICLACRAGNHPRCRGAVLFLSRTGEGPQPCHCEECAQHR